jgi:hypothetical protein
MAASLVNAALESIKFVGGLAGLASLGWQVYAQRRSYLQLDLSIRDGEEICIAQAKLENQYPHGKMLKYALLLIGPEAETPVETARALASMMGAAAEMVMIKDTDDIWRLQGALNDKASYMKPFRAVLPLPFFYDEQYDVGDERLQCEAGIVKGMFDAGVYAVRFFVFPTGHGGDWVRSTHAVFVVR